MTSTETAEDPMDLFAGLLVATVFAAPLTLYRAWVQVTLWRWFVVPTFHLHQIGMAVAVGLDALITAVTYQRIPNAETGTKLANACIVDSVLASSYLLAVRAIAHAFL